MIRLLEHKVWDFYEMDTYIYLEDNKIIGSYDIEYMKSGDIKLQAVYIQPEFRGKGIFHLFMKDVLDMYGEKIIYITVRKRTWIIKQYKKYGFKWNEKLDDNFYWMKRKNNK